MMFDEKTQLKRAQGGDLQAFNQLVLRYQAMAYSVAFRIVQNQDDATDVVQTSFLNAFHKLNQLQGDHFKSWFMRIVANRSYDLLRARKHRAVVSWEENFEHGEENAEALIDYSESPIAHAERSELNNAINQGLATLKADYRTVLVLSDIEGYSYDEIAEMMQRPIGTVKSSLSRARAKLRQYLLHRSDLLSSNYQPSTHQISTDRKIGWNREEGATVVQFIGMLC